MNEMELLITSGQRDGERFVVTEAGVRLGRSSSSDIAITDPELSRSHCLFELRKDEVWVTDLASANGTFVNGEEVTDTKLNLGDVVTVGTNTMVLVEKGAAAPAVQEKVGVTIDLGLSSGATTDNDASSKAHNSLRPILWGICGLVVVVAATLLIMKNVDTDARLPVDGSEIKSDKNRIVSLMYEKVDANLDGVFRYTMVLDTEGKLQVLIDDVPNENRHIDKSVKVPAASLERIAASLASSGVYNLSSAYSGIAARPNELKCWRLSVVRDGTIFNTYVENTTEPEELKAAVAALEAFANNELGIWAMQYSTDKLIEMAQGSIDSGDKKWEERNVDDGNLAGAIRCYKEAIFFLETVNPKPEFYNSLVDKYNEAKNELDRRYQEQSFKCDREIKIGDWVSARVELKILCEMVPDPQDPRHVDAAAKLLDVEGRLKRK